MRKLLVPALALLVLGASVARAADRIAEIKRVQQGMVAAWNTGDLASLMSNYAKDATILVSGMPPIEGLDAIAALSKAGIDAGIKTVRLDPVSTWIQGRQAVVRASYESLSPGSGGSRTEQGSLLAVLRREQDGRWLVVVESWTRARSSATP